MINFQNDSWRRAAIANFVLGEYVAREFSRYISCAGKAMNYRLRLYRDVEIRRGYLLQSSLGDFSRLFCRVGGDSGRLGRGPLREFAGPRQTASRFARSAAAGMPMTAAGRMARLVSVAARARATSQLPPERSLPTHSPFV